MNPPNKKKRGSKYGDSITITCPPTQAGGALPSTFNPVGIFTMADPTAYFQITVTFEIGGNTYSSANVSWNKNAQPWTWTCTFLGIPDGTDGQLCAELWVLVGSRLPTLQLVATAITGNNIVVNSATGTDCP